MENIFSSSKFITTEYRNYFDSAVLPWGESRARLYQHSDLAPWKGLPMFSKDFEVDDFNSAELFFTSLGCVNIYINGNKADIGEFSPGWSSYDKRTRYMNYDISDMVVKGKNRIVAVVAPGWYSGRIAGGKYGNDFPAVMLCVKCDNKTVVSTDDSWKCLVGGQIRTADIWDGEYVDAQETGFSQLSKPETELEGWKNADIYDYKGEVTPFIGPIIKVREQLSLKPEKITVYDGITYNKTYFGKINICNENARLPLVIEPGQKLIADFGQETVGWVKIKIKSQKGNCIKMRYAEFLNDSGSLSRGNDGAEGSVYTINLRSALSKAYYITNGNGIEEYRPSFTFFGYRYIEISAEESMEIIDLTAEIVGNDNVETGKIQTSDPLVNKLISNALWGQRGNYFSVPTDCPQRDERLGWTGDAQVFSVTAAYNADVYGFFRKWMEDMRDSQSESGGYADVNPRVGCCSSEDACAWADAGIIIPYNLYKIYGDSTMIKEHFDSMEKYISGLVEKYGFSGPVPRYGDWLAYDWCDNKFISSAYFVQDIDMMIYMCDVAQREDRKPHYVELRKEAYKYFCDNFMKDGKLTEKTQCNKIISLAFNLLDDDYAKITADELEIQIKENGDRLSCGFLGTYNLCPTLSKCGKNNTAYNLLLQRNEPSWLYSVDQGATTIWERWNSYTKDKGFGDVEMNSFNHYAYGSIVEWMYRFMAGIEVIEPGFKKFALCPKIDLRTQQQLPENQKNIKWVKAEYNSVSGMIRSEWNTENGLIYKCTVPENTTAVLELPVVADTISVNGKSQSTAGDVFRMTLEGGDYIFIQ